MKLLKVQSKIQQVYFLKLIKIYLMMREKNKKNIYIFIERKNKKKMQISIIIYSTISLKHF